MNPREQALAALRERARIVSAQFAGIDVAKLYTEFTNGPPCQPHTTPAETNGGKRKLGDAMTTATKRGNEERVNIGNHTVVIRRLDRKGSEVEQWQCDAWHRGGSDRPHAVAFAYIWQDGDPIVTAAADFDVTGAFDAIAKAMVERWPNISTLNLVPAAFFRAVQEAKGGE